jgi:hypothetical protein
MPDDFHYDPADWYWIVAGDESRAWSSVRATYVPASDTAFAAWLSEGNRATRIASEFELDQVLRQQVSSDGIGRAFTAQEALAALAEIDLAKVRKVLGRQDVRAVLAGDADKLAQLAYDMQPARRVDARASPAIEGVDKAVSVEQRLAQMELDRAGRQ